MGVFYWILRNSQSSYSEESQAQPKKTSWDVGVNLKVNKSSGDTIWWPKWNKNASKRAITIIIIIMS